MMKKLLYIFMCLAMTQACIKENFPTSPNDVTEGEEVTLSISVSVPGMEVATRAFGEYEYTDGSHPYLWVVVFDQQGYLVEYAKATEQSLTGGSLNETRFSVKLHETPEPCIIHYLLNYADNLDLAYGHESSLIGGLVVGPDKDVYWQRRVLQGGINDDPTYISNNFTRIPLVRNFAKITVKESADNFTLSGFYVLNRPETGTVAPYSNGAFVNYQPTLAADQSLYDALTDEGYVGSEPDGLEFTNTTAPAADNFSMNPTYLYENTAEDKNAVTTILIKGRFGSDTQDTYYKADLVTNDLVSGGTEYAHILRNFHYELNITSVIASGKDIAGAMNAAANNNLSGAVEIKDLTNVTNGTAGIYVSFTDTTLVSSAPIVLKYKFLTDVSNKNSYSNDRVRISAETGDVVSSTSKGSLITTPTTSSWYGYQELIINPQELPDYTKQQTIVLYDEATKLRREVIIRLRPKLTMEVECVPESVASVPGTPVVVNIKIPQGLNQALFPLEFAIEANTTAANNTSLKQYISPAKSENTSVRTGETIVTETNTNGTLKYAGAKSYQYIKTLSYEDYEKLSVSGTQVVLPVYFVTNIAASASTVYVSNMYFNDANGTFGNFNATYNFAELEFGGRVLPGVGNDVTFTFNMDTDAPTNQVTVTLVGLKPATGSALTQVGTTNQYTITPSATATNPAVTLNLVTTQEYGNVSVMLAAGSYVGAVATAPQDLYSFSDLAFSGNVPAKTGENVTFTFNMDTAAPNVPVTVTLVGLEPGEDSGMIRVGTTNQYTITPSATSVALNLVTTQESGTVSVSLAADHYNNASLSAVQKNRITIAQSDTISFTWSQSRNTRAPNRIDNISVEGGTVVSYGTVTFGGSGTARTIAITNVVFEGESISNDSVVTITVSRSGDYSTTFETSIGALNRNQ